MITIISLHTVIWFQLFLSNTNNLRIVIWFQVFLFNINNFQTYLFEPWMGPKQLLIHQVRVDLGVTKMKR